MQSLKFFSLKILVLASFFSLKAQEKPVKIISEKLTEDVYMLTGQGGNIGIYIGPDNIFMIDDQFSHLSDQIKETIKTLSPKPISVLFNTHMHGDHTGGNANFNTDEITLISQDNARKRVQENNLKKLNSQEIDSIYYNKMLPEITFSNDLTLHKGEETILAFHVHKAHTDGDAMVYFAQNNVLHMGDTYFSEGYPFIDLKSGGSVNGYIDAHKKTLVLIDNETKIIPGHGKSSTKKELETYMLMLEDIKENVLKAIRSGATLEEVETDTTISKKYDTNYGGGFISPERLRATFYTCLK
ncbi:MBL fold metallo-hydrolase [Cellulophaga sp. E6(2014)]|uniref:MBL fold metallo-hydrolase n=1 Tax=Cellulophaga sp. E6(2014) TaxID=1495334 RepID=UPI00051D72BA|nr:MBL fold metallo-hydrolase [Cellulophaga sp. E6(2014)]KGK31895.1 metallo-beta-lactamase [Cellulophaga sp. E6(2014)]